MRGKNKASGKTAEYCKKQYEKYIAKDYSRLKSNP